MGLLLDEMKVELTLFWWSLQVLLYNKFPLLPAVAKYSSKSYSSLLDYVAIYVMPGWAVLCLNAANI